MSPDYDICVIGGGVNGAGIARDAAGRGFRTLLVEKGDIACATSSSSTKLIHGGLRYLEHFAFRLVRESLQEREVLLRLAPHIIRPMDFVLPHTSSVRPSWMIRLGLFLYDRLGGRAILKGSRAIDLRAHPFGQPLKKLLKLGFTYQDCWVEDSRLVALNALDAKIRGAKVMTYTACTGLEASEDGLWWVTLKDSFNGSETRVSARAIVNAAGPWVRALLETAGLAGGFYPAPNVRLVKGSHLIVPRLFDGDQAYILQQPDKRIVFAIPYEGRYTLIGTTDEDFTGDPTHPLCSEVEMEYLCTAANIFFERQIAPADVLWTYSGVRTLVDDGKGSASTVSRDYVLHADEGRGAPILSVFGGKLTTYRTLSEAAVDRVSRMLMVDTQGWTARAPLPGGRERADRFEEYVQKQVEHYNWLPEDVARRYVRTYGTRISTIVGHATSVEQLGRDFGGGVYEAELVYAMHYEFVRTAEDFLWRRTKLGLHISQETAAEIESAFLPLYQRVKAL